MCWGDVLLRALSSKPKQEVFLTTFKYTTGEDIRKGDQILYNTAPGRIEFVAVAGGDPDLDWYVQEFGGGVMLWDSRIGSVFISADQVGDTHELEFVSRG